MISQRITQIAWSFYVLKYAMKALSHLVIDPESMSRLSLHRKDAVQLTTASALILSKPVSPAAAAMTCLEEPVVKASSPVEYLASAPPHLRRKLLACSQVIPAPVDHYMARPNALQHLTFSRVVPSSLDDTPALGPHGDPLCAPSAAGVSGAPHCSLLRRCQGSCMI